MMLTCRRAVDDGLVGRRRAAIANTALNGSVELGFVLTLAGEVGTCAAYGRGAVEEARLGARGNGSEGDADTVGGLYQRRLAGSQEGGADQVG